MKILVRNEGETVKEKDGIQGINWNTGAPLTNEDWYGGPYELKEYEETTTNEEQIETVQEIEEIEKKNPEKEEPMINIDGVDYTTEKLRRLLNSL